MQENKINVIGRLVSSSGKVHQNQEVYNTSGGVICTIKASHYKDPPKIVVMVFNEIGELYEQDSSNRQFEKSNTDI